MSGSMVGGVDSSIPLQAGRIGQGAQGGNPLSGGVQSLLPTLEGINRLKMFPGEQQIQQQQIQTGQQAIQGNAIKLQQARNGAVNMHLLPLLSQPDISLDDVRRQLGTAQANGFDTDAAVAGAAKTFPVDGTAAQKHQWLVTQLGTVLSPEQMVTMQMPKRVAPLDTGQQLISATEAGPLSATPGATLDASGRPIAAVTTVPSASDLATPVHYTGPDGTEVQTTKGEYAAARGVPAASLGPLVSGQSVPPPPGAGKAPAPSQAPAAGGGTTGGLTATKGPPAGQTEDIAAYKVAQNNMADQQKNLVAGQSALEALQLAHTGPGTSNVNKIKAFLIAQGFPGADAIDPNAVDAYQIARKNLLRFAQSSARATGTDLGLATQLESNANVDTLLNNVNEHILKQDIGLARQRIAQTLTAPPGGIGTSEFGAGYGAHVQKFTAQTDPVAFSWDLLTPGERQAHLDQISKQEGGLDKWKRSMQIARNNGLIRVPATQ